MKRPLLLLLLCALLAALPQRASAQSCSASASALSFGTISPISLSAVNATGTLTISCTWPAITLTPSVQVCLNLNGTTPRYLGSGSNQLQYGLYQDAAHSLAWGSTALGTNPISVVLNKPVTGTTATASVNFYGQIAGNQPTVPTTGNASTGYSQTLSQTSLTYGFFLLISPGCAALTTSAGSFGFSATATVVNNCQINATNMAFTATGLLGSALKATSTITARCTNGDAYRIALNGGLSGNVAARQMQRSGGSGAVNYQLYTDAARTSAWGDGTAGTTMATGTGSGNVDSFTVYGVVPAQSTPMPGSYSDTITATISF
ncbi:spore coat protein U-like protein [Paraburkholderia sp. BL23I1N1]|uniref:Csu type fimbrial protein n=1 Tax=Paraburkholderia sp. BL23I1N1 TaxID=1938802 RepID=UPI000E734537|nr:spore coat U domain-containing protein [Paraburkholderia sp. BL23I1N1]RKE24241.1 spore coat protein U-like protein [Paraburkholderia sp. BL23I1N1]